MVDRYGIRNVRQLQDLSVYLADTIGNMFSASSISEYLKSQRIDLTPKMILEYLGYLENAFFVRRVRPMDIQGKKQFRIGEKYYFEDLGIRHVLDLSVRMILVRCWKCCLSSFDGLWIHG